MSTEKVRKTGSNDFSPSDWPQKIDLEFHSQDLLPLRNHRQRGVAAGDVRDACNYAAVKKALLLSEIFSAPAGDYHPSQLHRFQFRPQKRQKILAVEAGSDSFVQRFHAGIPSLANLPLHTSTHLASRACSSNSAIVRRMVAMSVPAAV